MDPIPSVSAVFVNLILRDERTMSFFHNGKSGGTVELCRLDRSLLLLSLVDKAL